MSPEQHGTITGVFKNQIDWIPLSLGSVRPTQGRVVAIAQVQDGIASAGFIWPDGMAVHAQRLIGLAGMLLHASHGVCELPRHWHGDRECRSTAARNPSMWSACCGIWCGPACQRPSILTFSGKCSVVGIFKDYLCWEMQRDVPLQCRHADADVQGRWMRMFTIPNQSSVPKAWTEFEEDGRMKVWLLTNYPSYQPPWVIAPGA